VVTTVATVAPASFLPVFTGTVVPVMFVMTVVLHGEVLSLSVLWDAVGTSRSALRMVEPPAVRTNSMH
jgi:hypothetical protein